MKLKQKIAIFFTVLYTTSVMGIALSLHFCAGKLDNVKVFETSNSCSVCAKSVSTEKTDDCCKTSKVSLTVKDSHQLQAKVSLPKFFASVLFVRSPAIFVVEQAFVSSLTFISNKAPPLSAKIALHLFNCNFRN